MPLFCRADCPDIFASMLFFHCNERGHISRDCPRLGHGVAPLHKRVAVSHTTKNREPNLKIKEVETISQSDRKNEDISFSSLESAAVSSTRSDPAQLDSRREPEVTEHLSISPGPEEIQNLPSNFDTLAAARQTDVDLFRSSEDFKDDMIADEEKTTDITKRQKTVHNIANRAYNSQGTSGSLSPAKQ
ncbi:hypothetical protein BD560DRAFT_220574 [Blakeslea trispora]|nr:hypothetical protein BD560DRAFT_220574 [Blakeslea trispora]